MYDFEHCKHDIPYTIHCPLCEQLAMDAPPPEPTSGNVNYQEKKDDDNIPPSRPRLG